MTVADDRSPEHGGDDHLAAEYVLGVLPVDERLLAARRIESDAAFARLVDAWEERLSPLNAGYEEIEPPASVKTTIDARLFDQRHRPAAGSGILQSLVFWRSLAAAAVAALLIVIAVPFFQAATVVPAERLVASLAGDQTDVRYLAVYDERIGEVSLSHVTGNREPGHDFELWVIEGDDPPASLGVIPDGETVHLNVPPERRKKIASGAVFAISLEPSGGSPTGQPTGPVVATGNLKSI